MTTLKQPQNEFKKVLGFTNDYYTLWNVSKCWFPWVEDGRTLYYYPKINENYIQNLSKDYNEAVNKMNALFSEWIEDLELKGDYLRMTKSQYQEIADRMPANRFKFGKYLGNLIKEVDDKSYILWYYDAVKNQYDDAYQFCKKHLTETYDDLVEYKGDVWNRNAYLEEVHKDNKLEFKAKADKGHHFQDGEKVELELVSVHNFGFNGMYGWTNIYEYVSKCGKVLKYMGSANPKIVTYEQMIDGEVSGFTKVRATIKHDNYNGVNETKLKRIRIVK